LDEHVLASFIDLAIVGTDELVAAGIGDALRRSGISVVGPSKDASKVEWSKSFAKELMAEAGVATARSESFADAAAAKEALAHWEAPVVVKADGLALGKGVTVAHTLEEAAEALAKRGTPYRGVLYAGLIKTADGWKVLEYNARFGDPEAEVTLPRVEGDFAKLLFALGEGRLAEYVAAEPIRFSKRHYVDVVLCAENYPGPPKTGMPVVGLDRLPENVLAFHGATKRNATGDVVVSGGRVMHIVASGDTIA